MESVAARLGNTPAVCRTCYVHPAVIAAYLDGSLGAPRAPVATEGAAAAGVGVAAEAGLSPEEVSVLAFVERRLAQQPAA